MVAVSSDDVDTLKKFKESLGASFTFLSDPEGNVAKQYGGVAIILARFMPVFRTFAPFVAGIGKMNYSRFAVYNITGGVAWVLLFVLGGWWFGGLQTVQKNFHLVIIVIIVISMLPPAVQYLRVFLARRRTIMPEKPAGIGEEEIVR